MKSPHFFYSKILLFMVLSYSIGLAQMGPFPLYVSKQTGEFSTYSGSKSYTSDCCESGSASLTTQGPIKVDYSPALSMGPEESKTWQGTITPDVAGAPAPGSSTSASFTVDYDFQYWTEDGEPLPSKQGSETVNFTVYSIKVDIPDETKLCYNTPVTITADAYPSGGEFEWTSGSSNIELENENSQTVTVKFVGPERGLEDISIKYTIEGVSYTDEGKVNTKIPTSIDLERPENNFGASDRRNLTIKMGMMYVLQCVPFVTFFTGKDFDFANAGDITASDPNIKNALEIWYVNKARELIDSNKESMTISESMSWTTQGLYFLSTSTYTVVGTATAECRGDKLAVNFDVRFRIHDNIDAKSFSEFWRDQGTLGWPDYIEAIIGDIVLDKFFDCDYNIYFWFSEKTKVRYINR